MKNQTKIKKSTKLDELDDLKNSSKINTYLDQKKTKKFDIFLMTTMTGQATKS